MECAGTFFIPDEYVNVQSHVCAKVFYVVTAIDFLVWCHLNFNEQEIKKCSVEFRMGIEIE